MLVDDRRNQAPVSLPEGAEDAIRALLRHSVPQNTADALRSDWDRFHSWCGANGYASMPAAPEVLQWYVTAHANAITESGAWMYAPSTLARWVSSINTRHTSAGLEAPGRHPAVTATLRALRRARAATPARRAPLLVDDARTIVGHARFTAATAPQMLGERRDTAILLLGLAGALRRSEIVALTGSDVRKHPADGLYLTIRRSKSDKHSKGRTVTIPRGDDIDTCPVCALHRWVETLTAWNTHGAEAAHRTATQNPAPTEHVCTTTELHIHHLGHLFRRITKSGTIGPQPLTGQSVCAIVKRRAAQAGYNETQVAQLGAHSLRAGFVTQAVRAGATAQMIMTQTGHTDERMVRLYSRQHAGLEGNAVTTLGL